MEKGVKPPWAKTFSLSRRTSPKTTEILALLKLKQGARILDSASALAQMNTPEESMTIADSQGAGFS